MTIDAEPCYNACIRNALNKEHAHAVQGFAEDAR